MRKFIKNALLYLIFIFAIGLGIIYLFTLRYPGKILGDSTEYAIWLYKKQLMDTKKDNYRNFIIGDSRALFGLNPVLVGSRYVNVAIGGTTPFEGFITLKRLLRSHQIDTVILSYGIFHLVESDVLEKWTLPYRLPGLVDLNDLEKLERTAGVTIDNQSPGTALYFKRKATYLHLPYMLRSTFIENIKSNNFKPEIIEEMRHNAGFRYLEGKDSCDEMNTEALMALQNRKFAVNPIISSYLDSIYRTTKQHQIKLIFVVPPVNEASFKVLVRTGFWNKYIAYRNRIQGLYPEMILAEGYPSLPNTYFIDSSHLNKRGAVLFSRYVNKL